MTKIIDLLSPGDRVLCAVSGGADSVYLLHRLLRLAETGGFSVVCAHFNHRLRGAESDRDEQFVRDLCARWSVPLFVGQGDLADRSEAAARAARYAFLERVSREQACQWIVTAHTADDQAETMLLNLARGAGLRGLAGIPPQREKLLRPLLDTTRDEIETDLAERGIPHVEDGTNAANDYARNRLRHEAIPALRSVNAQAVRHAAETAALLREDEDFLQSLAAEVIVAQNEPGAALSDLRGLSRPVRARVFRRLFGAGLEQRHVEDLHAFCQEDDPAALDLPGVRVRREQGRLFAAPAALPPLPELKLEPGLDATLFEHGLRVTVMGPAPMPEINDSFTAYHFKCTEIRGKLSLTARKPGDQIRLAGRGCTKRLNDLFAERGVPASRRDQIPVIRDGEGLAAAVGFGVAERLIPAPGDMAISVAIENLELEREV